MYMYKYCCKPKAYYNNKLFVQEPPIFWIISGVVGAIVLVGLLFILLWKLLTHIHDRAEYARFEKERMR